MGAFHKALLAKSNENHDEQGRFASGDSSGSGGHGTKVDEHIAALNQIGHGSDTREAWEKQIKAITNDKSLTNKDLKTILQRHGNQISQGKNRAEIVREIEMVWVHATRFMNKIK